MASRHIQKSIRILPTAYQLLGLSSRNSSEPSPHPSASLHACPQKRGATAVPHVGHGLLHLLISARLIPSA